MFTFFALISTIHGCSAILHGVARRGGSFSRLLHNVSLILQVSSCHTYQHSMKYFMLSLHLTPFSGSSFNFGMGWRTM